MNDRTTVKNHFFRLLHHHFNNSLDENDFEYYKFLFSINKCMHCSDLQKNTEFYMSQNRNADFMILLDPYCLYKEYKEDDKEEIDELFRKILSSVKLSSDNSYITFTYKCANSPRQSPPENLNICEEFFKKEYSLVKPKNIIIFGKYAGDHLFHDQGMQFNNSDNNNKYADSSLFFTYNPVQIFYKPSLKKSVWEYLKIFKKKCGL